LGGSPATALSRARRLLGQLRLRPRRVDGRVWPFGSIDELGVLLPANCSRRLASARWSRWRSTARRSRPALGGRWDRRSDDRADREDGVEKFLDLGKAGPTPGATLFFASRWWNADWTHGSVRVMAIARW